MRQAKEIVPQGDSLAALLSNIERDGRILMRLRETIVDHSGQAYFDFDFGADPSLGDGEDPTAALPALGVTGSVHDLCDEAIELEEAGQLDEAAAAYRRALQLDPDHPTLHFDLGNVQFRLGQPESAIASYESALERDANFAMAWHNLGSAQASLGRWRQAETALRRALQLVPTYADSRRFTMMPSVRFCAKPLGWTSTSFAVKSVSQAEDAA